MALAAYDDVRTDLIGFIERSDMASKGKAVRRAQQNQIDFPDVIGEADAEVVAADSRLRRKLAGQNLTTVSASGKGAARITMPTLIGV